MAMSLLILRSPLLILATRMASLLFGDVGVGSALLSRHSGPALMTWIPESISEPLGQRPAHLGGSRSVGAR